MQAADKPPRRGKTSHMDSNSAASVQYDRWNEDNINMNVEASLSTAMRWDKVTSDIKIKYRVFIFLRGL